MTDHCTHCGAEIVFRPNPDGPEVWSDGDGYGCLQRAFDEFGDDEPTAPYPPHDPE